MLKSEAERKYTNDLARITPTHRSITWQRGFLRKGRETQGNPPVGRGPTVWSPWLTVKLTRGRGSLDNRRPDAGAVILHNILDTKSWVSRAVFDFLPSKLNSFV
jgi:hypothetical protein